MIVQKRIMHDKKLSIGHSVNWYISTVHNHEYYEFLYILRGTAINVVNDEVQFLKNRSLVCIRPDDVHYIRKNEEKDELFELFNIPVSVEFMEEQFKSCPSLREKICSSKIPVCISVSNTEFGVLCAKALKLEELESRAETDETVRNEREYIYFSLARELCACMLEYKQMDAKNMPNWFTKLIVEMEYMPIEKLTYKWLLESSGISQAHLWKVFQRFLGTSPVKYINKRKMQAAYDMVIDGEKSLTDIAFDLGYNNYTHFSREFKMQYGSSPRELSKRKL